MHLARVCAMGIVLTLSASCIGSMSVSAETEAGAAAEAGEFADFGAKWPDKFCDGDEVEISDNSYKSHDINVRIDRYDNYGVGDRITGDLNESGDVTLSDAVLCTKLLTEISVKLTDTGTLNADVNEDGIVNLIDSQRILQYLDGSMKDTDFFIEHKLVYFVADIYVRSLENFRGGFASNYYSSDANDVGKIAEIGRKHNAVFAINCDYCSYRTNGIIYRNGVMYRENKRSDLCLIYKNGEADILSDSAYRKLTDEQKSEIWHTISFGPKLVHNYQVDTKNPGGVVALQQPRSVFGYYEPGHYCFVIIEGRRPGYSGGLFLPDVCNLMVDLGVKEAFNMDGGSSSVIALNGQQVNWPAWNGRATSDILYLVEKDQIVPMSDPPEQ